MGSALAHTPTHFQKYTYIYIYVHIYTYMYEVSISAVFILDRKVSFPQEK